jgi:hypothetical protein
LTPALPVSGDAAATRVAVEPVFREVGGFEESVTAIAGLLITVAVAVADFVGSAVDCAVTVIVPPMGIVDVF